MDYNEGGGAGGAGMSHEAITDSRYRFLTWIDNTFHDLEVSSCCYCYC